MKIALIVASMAASSQAWMSANKMFGCLNNEDTLRDYAATISTTEQYTYIDDSSVE